MFRSNGGLDHFSLFFSISLSYFEMKLGQILLSDLRKFPGRYALWWIWCSSSSNRYNTDLSHSGFDLNIMFSTLWITTSGLGGFMACGSLSQRNGEPTKASRPWDIVLHPTSIFFMVTIMLFILQNQFHELWFWMWIRQLIVDRFCS